MDATAILLITDTLAYFAGNLDEGEQHTLMAVGNVRRVVFRGNPLGAVQTYCSTRLPRVSTAGVTSPCGYIILTSAVTAAPAPPQIENEMLQSPTWNTQTSSIGDNLNITAGRAPLPFPPMPTRADANIRFHPAPPRIYLLHSAHLHILRPAHHEPITIPSDRPAPSPAGAEPAPPMDEFVPPAPPRSRSTPAATTRSAARATLSAPAPTPTPTLARATDAAGDTASRMREIERHLGVLGVRAAALDAAAADRRRRVGQLREKDCSGEEPTLRQPARTLEAPTRARLLREARADLRASFVRRGGAAEGNAVGGDNILASARAAIAEERSRLSEVQGRLAVLEASRTAPTIIAASTLSSVTPSSVPPSTIPAAATPTALVSDIRGIVREQTALLLRVGGLIADVGTQIGVLEGARAAAHEAGQALAHSNAGAAALLARARETIERADRAVSTSADEARRMDERLGGLVDPSAEGNANAIAIAIADADATALRTMARQMLTAALTPASTTPEAAAAASADAEDKPPVVRRRIFFDC
ncbi:hypothetical protein C8R47DRAFT_1329326 [Mycena vitilis]|nr:hypothetical protein C8R47DRAFT_1329326 [Mycena vitilis]